jgi:hypothetical protein
MGDEQRFWRVYRLEWSVVFISDSDGENGIRECLRQYESVYAGKVKPSDYRLGPWSLTEPDAWPWALELLLPVMKGEYVNRPLALGHAHKIDGVVVLEGSTANKTLLNYGKRMLREVKSDAGAGDRAC